MANIITDIYLNGITEGLDEKHNLLKNIFSEYSNLDCENLNKFLHIKEDILFNNLYNDILVKANNNRQVIRLLNKYGYEKISKSEYPFSEHNFAGGEKIQKQIFEEISFVENINIKDEEFIYFVEQNYLILFNESNSKRYFFNLENINIKDLKIDKYNFVYILYNYRGKQYLTKTHLAKIFAKYNEDKSGFNIKETFFTILLEDDKDKFYSEIVNVESNRVYLLRDKIYYRELYNKYFFTDNDVLYFNHHGEMDNYKKYFLEEIQVEFNNIYNYLNFLGLNEFKIKNRKLSSYEIECFRDLFANKFDNTFNGSTNYFIIKNHYEHPNVFKLKPSYHINYKDNVFAINGNFNYKMQKGKFKIIIKNNSVSLYRTKHNKLEHLDNIIISKDSKEIYFYQLRFQLLDYSLPEYYEFNINVEDSYVFKFQTINKNFDKLHCDKDNINYFLSKENNVNLFSRGFKDNSIKFWNLFDFNKKRFIYNSIMKELKANEYFDLTNVKDFKVVGTYDVKNNRIYARDNCQVFYTIISDYSFELINSNGYISDFWINNQGKELFFKKENNQLSITDFRTLADFKVRIPEIKDYININKSINNIDILMNDDLEYELDYTPELLATTKFLEKPLFWKIYIDSDDFSIFDEDGLFVSDTFSEPYNSGKIVYFNKKQNKKYYYVVDGKDEKNYFEPLKAFENIKIYYHIDKLGICDLKKEIKLLSLNTNKKISDINFTCKLYIYDKNNNVKTITLNKNSLNKAFEFNDYIDKVKLEVENPEDFYLTEESNTNISYNDKIIYFKNDYDDICYISKETPNININDFLKQICLNKKYSFINNQLIEDVNGNIFLEELKGNCLFIEELNKEINFNKKVIKSYSASGYDEFYINNFKSLGIEHEFLDINDSQKIETYIEEIDF